MAELPLHERLQAALDLAQTSGQAHAHPAFWRRIHTLAERTRAQPEGPVRQLLHARLHSLLAALPPAPELAPAAAPAAAPALSPAPVSDRLLGPQPAASALRPLLDALQAALSARPSAAMAASGSPLPTGAALADAAGAADTAYALPDTAHIGGPLLPELHAVARHRATWARLRAEQRLAQTQTALPAQAGPMNSQRLLHGALALMRDTAPAYLSHLMTQAEALMWLEQALAPAAAPAARPAAKNPAKNPAPPPAPPKTSRSPKRPAR
ncbi:MAG: DUF2894 domain-containing protein [Pseudomonadota bacterium]|nr:DUF2894 domain-containing protein [Pseudomonadota bacterium]